MKLTSLLAFTLCTASCAFAVPIVINDDFNGNSVNPGKWEVLAPHPQSSVTVANGLAEFTGRAGLLSVGHGSTVDITGRFMFTGTYVDRFVVFTRTTGDIHADFLDVANGLVFRFQQDISKVAIDEWNGWTSTNGVLGEATVSLPNHTWFDFRVVDTGSMVALYFNDLDTPIITATSSFTPGDRIAVNNNWPGSATVRLDYLRAASVPEGGLPLLFGLVVVALVGCCRRYSKKAGYPNACFPRLAPRVTYLPFE